MEFRQIQYFVCLFREGSVTRASRRLNIVQPALSMQISKLEEEVGKPLFIRNAQGMLPTAEGQRMYELFEPLVRGFIHAKSAMLQADGELGGEVRIGTVATVAQGVLVDAIALFSRLHPKVRISITDGYGGPLADAVAGGLIEAAIVNRIRRPPSLIVEEVVEEDLLLLVGPKHELMHGPVGIRSLEKLKLVLPTMQHGLRGLIESQAEAHKINLNPAIEIDSIPAIIKLLSEHSYSTLLPRGAVLALSKKSRLLSYEIRPKLTRELVSVTHPHRALTPQTAVFLAILVKLLRDANGDHVKRQPCAAASREPKSAVQLKKPMRARRCH